MSEARPTRTLLACVAGVTLVFVGIATWNDETLFSAMRYGVVPAGIAISQIAYSRTGPDAGFGTAISLAVPIMTLAASLRYALWPNETESAVAFIGITGIVMGLLWGVVMPIFTPPNRNSTD